MESGKLPNGWIRLVGGAPASNRGIAGRLRNHHAADSRAAATGDWVSYEEICLGAGICHRGSKSLLGVGHAADGFSGILLLSEKHQFPISASCGETRNDVAGDIRRLCKPLYQCVRNHKSGISRKSTKRPAIINIQRKPVSHGHAVDGFSGILLLSEEHEFALTASCGETGNDVAGDIRRPCEYVYQRVCHHKSGISRKHKQRPAVMAQQGVA